MSVVWPALKVAGIAGGISLVASSVCVMSETCRVAASSRPVIVRGSASSNYEIEWGSKLGSFKQNQLQERHETLNTSPSFGNDGEVRRQGLEIAASLDGNPAKRHVSAGHPVDARAKGRFSDARNDPTTGPSSKTAIRMGVDGQVTNSLDVGRVKRPTTIAVGGGVTEKAQIANGKATSSPENIHLPAESTVRATAVWSELLKATSSKGHCQSPPCIKGEHLIAADGDLAEAMSHVEGAIVVRRPGLTRNSYLPMAPNKLDFPKTLESYFPLFRSSLVPRPMLREDDGYICKEIFWRAAVCDGKATAGRYLSGYYPTPEFGIPTSPCDGYERIPTLVAMADVYVNTFGYVWNERDYIVQSTCIRKGVIANMPIPHTSPRFEKLFVITQHHGRAYYHLIAEVLPRLTSMLDVLLEHTDILIAAPPYSREHMDQLVELLGIEPKRLVVVDIETQVHATLAILPESSKCMRPNTAMVSMLKYALLKGMYPESEGVPPPVPRPVILLIVRHTRRGLGNSDQVRDALTEHFPTHDVVEFFGGGDMLSQLKLFATASLIVAPHGAGLANIVVSPIHTPVLEIGPESCPMCYVHLALKLQHIYGRHLGGDQLKTPCKRWYTPNTDEIVKLARDLLEAKRQADTAYPLPEGVYRGTTDTRS